MAWIINAIGWLVDFFASGKAKSAALFPLKITATTLTVSAVTLYISAYLLLASFFVLLFNKFHDILNSYNEISFSDSSLNSVWNAFLGIMNATGLSSAISSAFALFITLYFTYFGVKIAKIIAHTSMTISSKLNETLRTVD
ncbi:hypothetical protein [Nautilia sp.]